MDGELGKWKSVGEDLSVEPWRKMPFDNLSEEVKRNGLEGKGSGKCGCVFQRIGIK